MVSVLLFNTSNPSIKYFCYAYNLHTAERFKRLISNISHEKTWTWLRKGNLKRETKSLLIAPQNNTIRTNYIKARIVKRNKIAKSRLCGD